MKYFLIIFSLISILSCRGDGLEHAQRIDQILHVYIQNAQGQDLLNKQIAGAYNSVEFKDLSAQYDRVSVNTTARIDDKQKHFLEYVAGATRVLQPNATDASRVYKSTIAIQYRLTATSPIQEGILEIFYSWTPTLFQVSSIYYNQKLIFQKSEGQTNIITIIR